MAVYLVSVNPLEPPLRLVNARTKSQAIAHVLGSLASATLPTPRELLKHGADGMQIEDAGEEKKAAE